jgi:hypothetical protein
VALCNPDTVNVKLQDQRRGIAEPMDLKAASQRGKTGNGGKLPFHHSGFSATLLRARLVAFEQIAPRHCRPNRNGSGQDWMIEKDHHKNQADSGGPSGPGRSGNEKNERPLKAVRTIGMVGQ